jgi:hypothetical protein
MSDAVIEQPQQHAEVEAGLNYLVPTGVKPIAYAYDPPPGVPSRSGEYRTHAVKISNARLRPPPGGLSLDRNGFELHRAPSVLSDFSDDAAIRSAYYAQAERLLKAWTGAKRVVIFDHTLRDGDRARADGVREPVHRVHNDQTFVSAPRRVRDHLPADEAARLLQRRFAIVNLWRPVGEAVESSPLALCDSRSIGPRDLIAQDLVYRDFTGETYAVAYNARHRWYTFPHMSPDEALIIKIYDSAGDGVSRFTAHTAFDDPASPADARPRRSIELRSLLFF